MPCVWPCMPLDPGRCSCMSSLTDQKTTSRPAGAWLANLARWCCQRLRMSWSVRAKRRRAAAAKWHEYWSILRFKLPPQSHLTPVAVTAASLGRLPLIQRLTRCRASTSPHSPTNARRGRQVNICGCALQPPPQAGSDDCSVYASDGRFLVSGGSFLCQWRWRLPGRDGKKCQGRSKAASRQEHNPYIMRTRYSTRHLVPWPVQPS